MENWKTLSTLGERARWARIERGYIKASHFAEACELKKHHIQAIENRPQTQSKYAPKLAEVLECDLTWLVSGSGKPWDGVSEPSPYDKAVKQLTILSEKGKLSEEDFASLADFMEFLAQKDN